MIFGDPQQFAVEAVLDKPHTACGPVPAKQVAGRIRVIVSGGTIGNFDVPHCWLGPPCDAMLNLPLDSLWHPFFSDLDCDEIFDVLNLVEFGADRDGCIEIQQCEAMIRKLPFSFEKNEKYTFLLNTSEAFDGWKCFLIHPPGTDLVVLINKAGSNVVDVSRFSVKLFQNTINHFDQWIKHQER